MFILIYTEKSFCALYSDKLIQVNSVYNAYLLTILMPISGQISLKIKIKQKKIYNL